MTPLQGLTCRVLFVFAGFSTVRGPIKRGCWCGFVTNILTSSASLELRSVCINFEMSEDTVAPVLIVSRFIGTLIGVYSLWRAGWCRTSGSYSRPYPSQEWDPCAYYQQSFRVSQGATRGSHAGMQLPYLTRLHSVLTCVVAAHRGGLPLPGRPPGDTEHSLRHAISEVLQVPRRKGLAGDLLGHRAGREHVRSATCA